MPDRMNERDELNGWSNR